MFSGSGPPWINLKMIIIIITHQMKRCYVWSSVVRNQKKEQWTEIDRWKCMRMSLSQAPQYLSLSNHMLDTELPNRKSDLTVTVCLISAGTMSSCKSWIQTVQGMKLKLCSFISTFSHSFQLLTFPHFLAFLFSFGSWQGLEVKQCCGQLWNVESASGADLEPIRTQKQRGQGRRERE